MYQRVLLLDGRINSLQTLHTWGEQLRHFNKQGEKDT